MELTQKEADFLMKIEKKFLHNDPIELGSTPLNFRHPLVSVDGRERFSLDIWRGSINLNKYRLQERARSVFVLVRVDIGGAPHTNPDGVMVPAPHIHLYREGYGDKWAYPISDYPFQNPGDIVDTFFDFAHFCNIKNLPDIQRRMV